jgi:hypothetical protein
MPDMNDGCQYASCEDLAPDSQLLNDGDAAVEVILCRGHAAFVRDRLSDPGWRVAILEDEYRARVRLLPVVPATSSVAA